MTIWFYGIGMHGDPPPFNQVLEGVGYRYEEGDEVDPYVMQETREKLAKVIHTGLIKARAEYKAKIRRRESRLDKVNLEVVDAVPQH